MWSVSVTLLLFIDRNWSDQHYKSVWDEYVFLCRSRHSLFPSIVFLMIFVSLRCMLIKYLYLELIFTEKMQLGLVCTSYLLCNITPDMSLWIFIFTTCCEGMLQSTWMLVIEVFVQFYWNTAAYSKIYSRDVWILTTSSVEYCFLTHVFGYLLIKAFLFTWAPNVH